MGSGITTVQRQVYSSYIYAKFQCISSHYAKDVIAKQPLLNLSSFLHGVASTIRLHLASQVSRLGIGFQKIQGTLVDPLHEIARLAKGYTSYPVDYCFGKQTSHFFGSMPSTILYFIETWLGPENCRMNPETDSMKPRPRAGTAFYSSCCSKKHVFWQCDTAEKATEPVFDPSILSTGGFHTKKCLADRGEPSSV